MSLCGTVVRRILTASWRELSRRVDAQGLEVLFPSGRRDRLFDWRCALRKRSIKKSAWPFALCARVAAGAKKTASDLPDRIRRTIGTHLKPEGWAQRDDQERPSMRPSTGNHPGLTTCIPCFQRTGTSKNITLKPNTRTLENIASKFYKSAAEASESKPALPRKCWPIT